MATPSLSAPNYSTLASTLQAVRAENFRQMQAEEEAKKALEEFSEPRTEALFQALTQRFFNKPEKKLKEHEFRQIKQKVVASALAHKMLEHTTPLPQVELSSILDIPRCWSSKRMSELMNWRNPDVQAKPTFLRSILNITKSVVAEVALPFLTLSAVVEAVATKVLVLGALALRPISHAPIHFVSKHGINGLSKSALFTTVWTASTLWHNIFQSALVTDERDARRDLFKGYFKI